jgi:hypothetical protein
MSKREKDGMLGEIDGRDLDLMLAQVLSEDAWRQIRERDPSLTPFPWEAGANFREAARLVRGVWERDSERAWRWQRMPESERVARAERVRSVRDEIRREQGDRVFVAEDQVKAVRERMWQVWDREVGRGREATGSVAGGVGRNVRQVDRGDRER